MRSKLTRLSSACSGSLLAGFLLAGGATSLPLPAQAQGIDQEQVVKLREEGIEAARQGKLDVALAKFKEAIALDDSHADTWFHYGQTFQRQGNLDEAIKHYTKAIFLLSGHHKAFHNRGVAYWIQGKTEDALSDLDEAVRLKPKYFEAWNTRASLLASIGKAKEAMEDATQAIYLVELRNDTRKKKRFYVAAYHTRAVAALRIGELKQAKQDLAFACLKEPGHAAYRLRLAVALFRLGEHEAALEAYTASLGISKQSDLPAGRRAYPLNTYLRARCVAGRGQAKWFLGDKEGALADLAEAGKLTPDHAYTPLWVHGLGGTSKNLERLSTHAYEKKDDLWIQQLLLMYRGKKTTAELLTAAESAEGEAKAQRLLQVYCYSALLAERAGKLKEARALYEKATTQKVLGYTEYWWAKLRLEALPK